MSQNNHYPSLEETVLTLSDVKDNSNDDWKSVNEIQADSIVVNTDGWANFDNTNLNSDSNSITTIDDNWADFASNTESSINKQLEKTNKDDDAFGDYSEVQISSKSENSSLSINALNFEQIDSLISTCFPLESPTDTDDFIPFSLPTFTTFNDQIKQLPCFQHSLSLWKVLSNISNDPIGIQYQWRKSNIEYLFHQALGAQKRFQSENSTTNSNVNTENNSLSEIVSQQSAVENKFTDPNSSSLLTDSCKIEEDLFEVSKTPDLDYYVPQTSISTKEEQTSPSSSSSPSIKHRNNNLILASQQSTPIKTINLDPGSTTVLNDDVKPSVNSIPNFSFINPKALMLFPSHITHE